MKPFVSVIMAVYNNADTVEKTINSVLCQTFQDFELLIIEDRSEDNSYQVLKRIIHKDKRIRLYQNASHMGLTKSLNVGLNHSTCDLIARIDADDWWEKDKLKQQVQFLQSNPTYAIIGTNVVSHNYYTKKKIYISKPKDDSSIRRYLFKGAPFIHSAIVFRKALINRYDAQYRTSQDYDLYRRILKKGKGHNIQKFLTHRLTHKRESVTTRKGRIHKINNIRIRYRIFRDYQAPLIYYIYFIPDILMFLLPPKVKVLKQKLHKLFNP